MPFKMNIKVNDSSSNELLSFLTNHGQVNHFVEVIPSASDIFIQHTEFCLHLVRLLD